MISLIFIHLFIRLFDNRSSRGMFEAIIFNDAYTKSNRIIGMCCI